jgi:hypothetical protein
VPQLAEAARLIRHHHECMDGSGYPDQLGGLMIPLGARILAVANDYDGLQAGTLTLAAHPPKDAQEIIVKQRGKRYDPTVVDAFMALLAEAAPKQEVEVTVSTTELKPGMLLTRDLLHRDGYLLLPKGRVVDAAAIAQLLHIEETDGHPLTIHIRRGSGPATLRARTEEAPPRMFKEVQMSAARLKEGMLLARNLQHHEGYLLLARGNHLDEPIIRQLRDIEKASGKPFVIYIRMDDR